MFTDRLHQNETSSFVGKYLSEIHKKHRSTFLEPVGNAKTTPVSNRGLETVQNWTPCCPWRFQTGISVVFPNKSFSKMKWKSFRCEVEKPGNGALRQCLQLGVKNERFRNIYLEISTEIWKIKVGNTVLKPPWATQTPLLDCFQFSVAHGSCFSVFCGFQKGEPVFFMSFWQIFPYKQIVFVLMKPTCNNKQHNLATTQRMDLFECISLRLYLGLTVWCQ